jgi:hypothetical protein
MLSMFLIARTSAFPHLPLAEVALTRAADYQVLLAGQIR